MISSGSGIEPGSYVCECRITPCSSMMNIARLALPRSSLYTPYSFATAPFGWKSASIGKSIPPSEAAHAFEDAALSTLTSITSAFSAVISAYFSRKPEM
jgi:hypothetical protein